MAERAEARPIVSAFAGAERLAVMHQTWLRLTFLHGRYVPSAAQRLLPRGLEMETYGGAAWVGLTPFVAAACECSVVALNRKA